LWHQLEGYNFEDYLQEWSKSYQSHEYGYRRDLFNSKLAEIKMHNADPSKTWKMGVNQFTDMTYKEFSVRLGVNRALLYSENYPYGIEAPRSQVDLATLPGHVDWRDMNVISNVKDQGQCGSCWTFGTTETIEAYYAQKHNGALPVLSEQEILDCTPNPNGCGGTGGCEGGTGKLAMAKLIELGGQTSEWKYPYISYWGEDFKCKFNVSKTTPTAVLANYVLLPSNHAPSIIEHLANSGPLIINIDASAWSAYESGVFNGCNQTNPEIDHIVQAVGYGTDTATGEDYWLVRNSWSPTWGENGYIRIKRQQSPACGMDLNPQDGNICKSGPSQVKVCGTCGIIYQAAYPILK
jgi:cathepsin L